VLGLFVLATAAIILDAYWQVHQVADPLGKIQGQLSTAREALSHGKLPIGDPFTQALETSDRAAQSIDDTNWTFRLVEKMPVLGRPIKALRQMTIAAGEWAEASVVVRDILLDTLGDKALRGTGERDLKGTGTPVLSDGVVDVNLIATLPPRFEQLIKHLEAAAAAIRGIKDVPFYHRLTAARELALSETAKGLQLAKDAIAVTSLLPPFLGAEGPKTYFLALQNNSDLRGPGGAVLAYAMLTIDKGKLDLTEAGSIADLDTGASGIHARLPPDVSYWIKLAKVNPRLANGSNYSPNLPVVAQAWAAMIEKQRGIHIDGAIALDPVAVAYSLGTHVIRLPYMDDPITADNAVKVMEHDQYLLEPNEQHAFPKDVVRESWKALINPSPFVGTLQKLGKALRQKHIQMWSSTDAQEALMTQLGWDGGLHPYPGDYLFLADNKRIANKVDYFSSQKITYKVAVQPNGGIDSTYTVALRNDTPSDEPLTVAGRGDPFGANVAMMNLYVPNRARFTSVDPEAPLTEDIDPKGFVKHVEDNFLVFTKTMNVAAQSAGTLTYRYLVPLVIKTTPAGKVYQLTLQHQPLVNPADVTVVVTLPEGTVVKSTSPGWTVDGNVATFHASLEQDLVTRIVF